MATKSNTPLRSKKEIVMIIAEERNTLRTLFDNAGSITGQNLRSLNLRSRFNPDLVYYKVHCEDPIRYGLDADDLFDIICDRYKESGYQPLNELFSYIERI